jgi:hypothetical protein
MQLSTYDHVLTAISRAQELVSQSHPAAVVVLDCQPPLTLVEHDYWQSADNAARFERRAGELAVRHQVRRATFAVPLICQEHDDGARFRPPSGLPRKGQTEQLWVLGIDLDGDGMDLCRVLYTRRPDGTPVFADPQLLMNGGFRLGDQAPGFALVKAVAAGVR